MQNVIKTFVASASELQSSDLYMTVKATMFTVPDANLNGVRCTAEFLEEIVADQDKYIGLPLCADVVNLVKGRYTKLGHCYNATTGTFSSSIIGSFYKFEKEELKDGGMALIGYARILKRNKKVCKAVSELFADNALKFSFEISCGSYTELEDNTILIDKAENNFIEGMCIVSFPACPDAVALELVAEVAEINGLGKEADHMTDVIESVEMVAEESAEAPAEEVVAQTEETAEVSSEEPETIQAEEQPVEASTETAEVYVSLEHTEIERVHTYDSDTGVSTDVIVTTEERAYGLTPETANSAVAEAEEVIETAEEATEEVVAEEAPAEEHAAEQVVAENPADVIAELRAAISALQHEVAELRAVRVVAEQNKEEEVNPFMAEISTPVRYSLLESVEKPASRSLLERA